MAGNKRFGGFGRGMIKIAAHEVQLGTILQERAMLFTEKVHRSYADKALREELEAKWPDVETSLDLGQNSDREFGDGPTSMSTTMHCRLYGGWTYDMVP